MKQYLIFMFVSWRSFVFTLGNAAGNCAFMFPHVRCIPQLYFRYQLMPVAIFTHELPLTTTLPPAWSSSKKSLADWRSSILNFFDAPLSIRSRSSSIGVALATIANKQKNAKSSFRIKSEMFRLVEIRLSHYLVPMVSEIFYVWQHDVGTLLSQSRVG